MVWPEIMEMETENGNRMERVSLIAGMEYGMERWNRILNGW